MCKYPWCEEDIRFMARWDLLNEKLYCPYCKNPVVLENEVSDADEGNHCIWFEKGG